MLLGEGALCDEKNKLNMTARNIIGTHSRIHIEAHKNVENKYPKKMPNQLDTHQTVTTPPPPLPIHTHRSSEHGGMRGRPHVKSTRIQKSNTACLFVLTHDDIKYE